MERVVTVGNNALTLDFTGIFDNPAEKQAPRTGYNGFLGEGEYKTLSQPQKPPEAPETALNGEQAILLLREHEEAAKAHQQALEVYRSYQENTKRSSQIQTELLKGVKAGESVYSLFLKAARVISLMTDNSAFYSQIEADTIAIYGAGLLQKDPLQIELADTRKRLERLQEAEGREQAPDARQRIKGAVEAHRKRVAELESLLA